MSDYWTTPEMEDALRVVDRAHERFTRARLAKEAAEKEFHDSMIAVAHAKDRVLEIARILPRRPASPPATS